MLKHLFVILLVFNLVAEGWIGAILLVKPGSGDVLQTHTAWATDYGFAALAMASMIFWVWRYRFNSRVVILVLGLLITFHTGTGIATGLAVADGDPAAAPLIHALIAAVSAVLFLTRHKWCDPEGDQN